MLKKSKLSQKRARSSASEDINPMNYMSNLSDAMLVLAVGIMLALVAAWEVDITAVASNSKSQDLEGEVEIVEDVESLHTSSDGNGTSIEDYGLIEYGTVYIDENGNYYVIGDGTD